MTDLTQINTPFGRLDDTTKGALLLAQWRGQDIELQRRGVADSWDQIPRSFPIGEADVIRVQPGAGQ